MSGSDGHGRGHHHDHGHPALDLRAEPAPACPQPRGDAAGPDRLIARSAAVRRVFWVTLVLNFAVAAAKGVYAWLSGSVTLGADAFHSVLDGSANVLALVGMRLSTAPVSARHPYGRRKIELLAALAIGVLIAVSLAEVTAAAIEALRGRRAPDIGWAGFAVVLASMAVNFFVSRYEHRKGHELASPLLSADAHHTESDLWASGAVLVAFAATKLGVWWADGVCGFVVVLMVGNVAWQVFRENVPMLLDAAVLDPALVRRIALEVGGVRGVHRVRSRGTRWAVELDLHVEVPPEMTVRDAHDVACAAEAALRERFPHLLDVAVHIEPQRPHPEKSP